MNYAKLFYNDQNCNDDIHITKNHNLKLEYKIQPQSNNQKDIHYESENLNHMNKFSNINDSNNNNKEAFKNLNNNISSSLKDQILSPGDEDICPNFDKNKYIFPIFRPYLDDDIIFNKYNLYYLSKNNSALSLLDIQTNNSNKNSNFKFKSNLNLKSGKKTLILDLDETLVHSSFKPII